MSGSKQHLVMGHRFFITFLTTALLMWTAGIALVVIEEARVKREIAAAKKAEEEARQARLAKLNEAWETSKYKSWDSLGDFKYDFNIEGKCKSEKECAEPIIVSKFDCDQMTLTLEWLRNDEVVDTSKVTKTEIYSLEEIKIYLETDVKNIEFVNIRNLQCIGPSY